jgi:hypothetical protein
MKKRKNPKNSYKVDPLNQYESLDEDNLKDDDYESLDEDKMIYSQEEI